MRLADGNDAVEGAVDSLQLTLQWGPTMKKLFMIAMAAVFSVAVVSAGYAQTPTTTEKKAEKAADKAEDKAEKADKKMKKAEKKAEKKMDKKEAANPCAAKAAEKK